jgi:mannose-6-phosphate isomerase-like protein (cupin superfamily)
MLEFAMLLGVLAGSDVVTHIPAKDIEAKLATPPARLAQAGNYTVMTMRRTGPGQAEWHEKDTDVVYVIDGAATLVTGGTMPDSKTTEPGEKRSSTIKDGKSQRIAKGDVLTIPNGVPHWFSAVEGSVTYFVVKVR